MLLESQQQKISEGWSPSKRALLDDESLRLAAITPSAKAPRDRHGAQRKLRGQSPTKAPKPEKAPDDHSSPASASAPAASDERKDSASTLPASAPSGPTPPFLNLIDALLAYLVHLTSNVLVVGVRWPLRWYHAVSWIAFPPAWIRSGRGGDPNAVALALFALHALTMPLLALNFVGATERDDVRQVRRWDGGVVAGCVGRGLRPMDETFQT